MIAKQAVNKIPANKPSSTTEAIRAIEIFFWFIKKIIPLLS
jgi:hypothetical protein